MCNASTRWQQGPLLLILRALFGTLRGRSALGAYQIVAIIILGLQTTESLAVSSHTAARSDGKGPVTEAIWHAQSLSFEYRSLNTYYSCASLEQKVRAILELVGAQQPVFLRTNCAGVPSRNIHVQIALATPIPATPENVQAASTFDARDELLARLRQVALPTAADIERFPARWQTRRLSEIRDVSFTHGDCDLLRGIHEQVFPRLAVRVASNFKINCDARGSNLRGRLKYEALIPTPSPFG